MSKKRWEQRRELVPAWVVEARRYVGKSSADFVHDNGKVWDVHKLTQMIRGHFHKVFVPRLGYDKDDARLKELFDTLLQIQNRRNTRAHSVLPSEAEVLQALRHMITALELMSTSACSMQTQLAKLKDLLREAQELVLDARKAKANSSAPPQHGQTLSWAEFETLVAYLATVEFEVRLEQEVGEFSHRDGNIAFKDEVQKRAGWKQHVESNVKSLSSSFKQITEVRMW